MKAMVIMCSPNLDGLTAACAEAAAEGIREGGGQVEMVALNKLDVGRCQACGNGWGTCRNEHYCQVEDDFQALQARILAADALLVVSPVYAGEMSESCRALTDRLRRCEGRPGEATRLSGKPMLLVGAAGVSGNGTMTCLAGMERWALRVGGRVYDLVPVKRWTRVQKLATIRESARQLAVE